ncbi:MAG: hypothetical protein R3F62_10455 [Planctomycetota bacterium]
MTDAAKSELTRKVLDAYREIYGDSQSEDEILSTDPNGYDLDPSHFYESLQETFGVPYDPSNDYFGGYGGTVQDTVDFLHSRGAS